MKRTFTRQLYELMSSMRFAVSLLTVLAIASIIGTVLKQNESYNNYLNQFGQFWFPVFESLGLYSVYSTAWFIAILTFLVASTAFCIIRQAPGMVRDMRSFRVHARETSLRQFAHHHSLPVRLPREEAQSRVIAYLAKQGYQSRAEKKADGVLIAAKAGSFNRIGYLLTHSAIIVICVCGLLNSDALLRLQIQQGSKKLTDLSRPLSEIGAESRLGPENWSYRGNVFLPEGKRSNLAVLNVGDGVLLQELPFSITLNKFHIDHYSTGMPKRFASDIVLTDMESGEQLERTLEVNKPVTFRGVTLYQASFEDGGSKLQLKARSLVPGADKISAVAAVVGENLQVKQGDVALHVEVTGFRLFNIENMAQQQNVATDNLSMRLGSAAGSAKSKDLKNVGPSFSYKVRDAAGQAREYNNYMVPMRQDGRDFFMAGMRENPSDDYRYLRIPADEDGRMDTWFALRAMLTNPREHALVTKRFALSNMRGDAVSETMRTRLADTAERTLQLYAERGFESLGAYISANVPEAEREKAADVFVRVLQGCIWEMWQLQRERQKQKPLEMTPARADFVRDTLNGVSDSFSYGAPAYLELDSFEEIKASVIQARHSPMLPGVYLGFALLIAGVFCMLYVRERRCFVLLKDSGEALLSFSSNRTTLDTDAEFAQHRQALESLLNQETSSHV